MNYKDLCFALYSRMQSFIAPTLKYSQLIYEEMLFQINIDGKHWLDIGCGHQLLSPWRYEKEKELISNVKVLVGVDYDFESIKHHRSINYRIRSDISHLPFADCSFDLVTANMVFEHLRDPERQLQEVFRILKPEGKLIFHTPNIWGYGTLIARLIPECIKSKVVYLLQNRKEEDVFPAYYRINSHSDINRISSAVGFKVDIFRLIVSSALLVMLPPLVIIELLFIRLLMTRWLRPFRTNIIVVCGKPINIT